MADEPHTLHADQARRLVRPIRDVLEEADGPFESEIEKRMRTYVTVVLTPCGHDLTRESLLYEIEHRLRPLLKEGKRARLT
jgi:hypothetical protein